MQEFINPNWHVILIHFPIALVSLGLLIEVISAGRDAPLRQAGRSMVFFGAIFALPALTAGLYAFRDALVPGQLNLEENWPALAARQTWTNEQWHFIWDHILYNGLGTTVLVLTSFIHVASSDEGRRRRYWLYIAGLIGTFVLYSIGAWHGGELVYRYGTGVTPGSSYEYSEGLRYYLPPLQLHTLLAGSTVAVALAALALMIRRWNVERLLLPEPLPPPVTPASTAAALTPQVAVVPVSLAPVARMWLTALIFGISTAVVGAWSFAGDFSRDSVDAAYRTVMDPDHRRLFVHLISGASILVLLAMMAIIARVARRTRTVPGLLAIVLVGAVGWQIWLGIAMLFDSHRGPLLHLSSPADPTPDTDFVSVWPV